MMVRYPWLLLLILLVPVAVWLRYRLQSRPRIRFNQFDRTRGLPPGLAVRTRWMLPVLYAIGLTSLIIAMARPQKGLEESKVHTEGIDIVLLVDVSPSMQAIDFSTTTREINRLDAAKRVIDQFIQQRPDDRISLIAFSELPFTFSPMTLDHGWLIQQLDRLEPGILGDKTAIGTALGSAINRLRTSDAKSRIVILLTDGVNNSGQLSPENAAEAAKALGVKVYTVGAGAEGNVRFPVPSPFGGTRYVTQPSEIDEATLHMIAETTGGLFFRATDMNSLEQVYDQIDKMEKVHIDVEQFMRFEERFPLWVGVALVALILEKLLSVMRWGSLP